MKEDTSEKNGAPVSNWKILQDELSADTLESLRQHFQSDALERLGEDGAGVASSVEQGRVNDRRITSLPANNRSYKENDYWDRRFETEEDYDWLVSYDNVATHIREAIPREARVLVVGCGNSPLSANMFDDGYRNLLSTDFSAIVIDKMRQKHGSSRPRLQWEHMDMLALDLEDGSIDAVVDKAAMDALMVDKGDPWNPDPATVDQAHRMCSEVSRVLAPRGVFVQLSFEQEHFRRKFLLGEHLVTSSGGKDNQAHWGTERGETLGVGVDWPGYGWDLTVRDIQREGGCFGHFLYMMRK